MYQRFVATQIFGGLNKTIIARKKKNMQVNGDESGENQGVNLFTCSVFFL